MPKTLEELDEWARLLRKENHPLADTMEEISEEWRADLEYKKYTPELLGVLKDLVNYTKGMEDEFDLERSTQCLNACDVIARAKEEQE